VYLNFEPPPEALSQVINFGQKKLSRRSNHKVQQGRLGYGYDYFYPANAALQVRLEAGARDERTL